MRIALIDVDHHSGFPNLALMKLSAWHKANGDEVEQRKAIYFSDDFKDYSPRKGFLCKNYFTQK